MCTASAAASTQTSGGDAEEVRGVLAPAGASASAGAAASSSSAAAAAQALNATRADDLEFNIAVDVIYHRARAAWLTVIHRVLMFGAIMFGTAAASDLESAKVCAAISAACAALDLVFDPTTSAAAHRETNRGLHAIMSTLRLEHFAESAMDDADKTLMQLSVDEAAPYNLARALARNEAIISLGRDPNKAEHVRWFVRPFVNVFRFEGS